MESLDQPLADLLPRHTSIVLDSVIWIYHLEEHRKYSGLTAQLLDYVNAGRSEAIVSEITLLEILVRPLRLALQDVADEYEILLEHFPHLHLVPVNRAIILKSASLRAQYGLRTPDALILATGLLQKATLAVTNDKRWKKVTEIEIICFDDLLD